MSREEELFNVYTQKYGGLYTIEDSEVRQIKRNFYQKIGFYKNERSDSKIPDIYLGITNYPRFQAFTFKKEGLYFVAISIGTIRLLKNFFNYLYSQPSFLDGDFGGEMENENINILNNNFKKLIDNFGVYDFEIEPISAIRKSFSYQTFLKAINYLLIHEFAHISHGHLDYNVQTDANFMMFEEDVIKNNRMDIRKALEYDADCSSTTINAAPKTFLGWSTHNAVIESRYLVVAMYFLFKLPALRDYNIKDFKNKTYPSPDQRLSLQLATLNTLFLELEKIIGLDSKHLIETARNTYNECIIVYGKLFSSEAADDKSVFFFSKQSQEYLNSIRNSWNEVRDELEKHAYVTIAPIDEPVDLSSSFDYEEIILKRSDSDVDGNNSL